MQLLADLMGIDVGKSSIDAATGRSDGHRCR